MIYLQTVKIIHEMAIPKANVKTTIKSINNNIFPMKIKIPRCSSKCESEGDLLILKSSVDMGKPNPTYEIRTQKIIIDMQKL